MDIPAFRIRFATPEDAPIIYHLICDLAEYEEAQDKVSVSAQLLEEQMRDEHPPFECLIGEVQEEKGGTIQAVGFALFYQTYSTWTGKPGLQLEDFYVKEKWRERNVGANLLRGLAWVVMSRGYGRIDLSVLNWNETAIKFYTKRGFVQLSEWSNYRLDEQGILRMEDKSIKENDLWLFRRN